VYAGLGKRNYVTLSGGATATFDLVVAEMSSDYYRGRSTSISGYVKRKKESGAAAITAQTATIGTPATNASRRMSKGGIVCSNSDLNSILTEHHGNRY
jgi:hypothetical protein